MTQQQQQISEVDLLKQRNAELSDKVNRYANLIQEADMAGPSLKLYFNNEEERHVVTMVAAQHGMTLPQYVMVCAIQNTNEVLKRQQEAQAAAAEEAAKTANDPVDTTSDTELTGEAEESTGGE